MDKWVYECPGPGEGLHVCVRADDGTARCQNCMMTLTKEEADRYGGKDWKGQGGRVPTTPIEESDNG